MSNLPGAERSEGENFRMAFEAARAMVMVNQEGKIVLVNSHTEKMFGYERQELLGQPIEILMPESSRKDHQGHRGDFFARPQERPMGAGRDLLAQRKDGTLLRVEIGLNPIETEEGTWVLSSIVDVAERRHTEQTVLRESEKRFLDLADIAPVMMWVAGQDRLLTFFNKEWLTFTGNTLDQSLGDGWATAVHADDRDRALTEYASAFDARRNLRSEVRLRRADGEYRWVLAAGVPRFESDGVFIGYVGSCMDITEVKQAQEEALGRRRLESLGQLASGIAHDFNNLLGGILSWTELILDEHSEGLYRREGLLNIKIAAVRGGEIVRQLMIYGSPDSPVFEPVDVSSLVEEMIELLRISISKRATLKIELDKGLPTVSGSPAQLRQVVMNLVTNASEAIGGDDGGVIRIATTRVRVGPDTGVTAAANLPAGDYLKLEVSDEGSGMEPEAQSKIFDPYFTTKLAGRGLGLATVHAIVRAHQGAINVESSLGKGTRFEVLLPFTNRTAGDFRDIAVPLSAGEKGDVSATVLVVEDETMLRLAVSEMLRKKGCSVIEAIDGNAAVDLFRANEPDIDVVLLDMALPGLSGPAVLVELRRIRPDVKVIITTAYSQETTMTAGGGPAWGFIRKPYRINDLVNLLRDACQQEEPSLAAETEALREAYAALNRNDIPATVKAFDPQIEWTEPAEYPGGGTYHGQAGVKAHLSQSRGNWAEGSCEPERFIVAGDKIIVFVYVRVRLKHNMEWHEGRLADVYTFRNGKAIQMRAFADRRQALEWAGVKASDANAGTETHNKDIQPGWGREV